MATFVRVKLSGGKLGSVNLDNVLQMTPSPDLDGDYTVVKFINGDTIGVRNTIDEILKGSTVKV